MLRTLILQLRTARHLKPAQAWHYVRRRALPARRVEASPSPPLRPVALGSPPCAISGIRVDDTTFRFLNVEADLAAESSFIDWTPPGRQRLWQYNLHYFDYLREADRSEENKNRLIESWIEENPQGREPAWEPFTTSLRIVNWILWLRRRPPAGIPARWLDSLYQQCAWLARHEERHLLANHYFENQKALLFAGAFFTGATAEGWQRHAVAELRAQLAEQTLADGGHYERSHQYHCLMLENYLDIVDLVQSNAALFSDELLAAARATAERGLDYLQATLFPDGTIPLFNDSAFGVAVPPAELFAYAKRLGLDLARPQGDVPMLIDRPDSGYYGLRTKTDMFIIDCGDIGPSYQPGHTHCDFLSYELMVAGSRLVVDTGVCEYEPGEMRAHVRSTKAHNTVSVDGGEQSEIWSEFRVARRARKLAARIEMHGREVTFRGACRGFFNVRGRVEHQRAATLSIGPGGSRFDRLVITDRLEGRGRHAAESFVHLHPRLAAEASRDGREVRILDEGSLVAVVRTAAVPGFRVEPGVYCPEFGVQLPNKVLVLRAEGVFPLELQYEIFVEAAVLA